MGLQDRQNSRESLESEKVGQTILKDCSINLTLCVPCAVLFNVFLDTTNCVTACIVSCVVINNCLVFFLQDPLLFPLAPTN